MMIVIFLILGRLYINIFTSLRLLKTWDGKTIIWLNV